MSTFPSSYPRLEVVTNATLATTPTLLPGQVGVFDKFNSKIVTDETPLISFGVGSFYTNDKIGGLLTNLKAPSFTPGHVNAQYVSKFYKVDSLEARNEIYEVGSTASFTSTLKFYKGKQYKFFLRLDDGPVIDLYGKTINREYIVDTGCIDECADPCVLVEADSVWVFKQLADQISADKVVNQLVKAQALNNGALTASDYQEVVVDPGASQTTKGGMRLTGAVIDIATPDITFDITNRYGYQPVHIIFTTVMDDEFDRCKPEEQINTQFEYNSKTLQEGAVAEGFGEGVLRDYVLSQRYKNLHFVNDIQVRTREGDPSLSVVDRAAKYTRLYLEYNVPYFMNQTNTFNSNRFVICFAAKEGTSLSALETFITSWLTKNGSKVKLETIGGAAQSAAVPNL